jgi:hypothetical protein
MQVGDRFRISKMDALLEIVRQRFVKSPCGSWLDARLTACKRSKPNNGGDGLNQAGTDRSGFFWGLIGTAGRLIGSRRSVRWQRSDARDEGDRLLRQCRVHRKRKNHRVARKSRSSGSRTWSGCEKTPALAFKLPDKSSLTKLCLAL